MLSHKRRNPTYPRAETRKRRKASAGESKAPIEWLPTEMIARIMEQPLLTHADRARAWRASRLLAPAASRPICALARAAIAAWEDGDYVSRLARLHNAIANDDPLGVHVILTLFPDMVEAHMPNVYELARWYAPVCVFVVDHEAPKNPVLWNKSCIKGNFCSTEDTYTLSLAPHVSTPLVRAVDVCARRAFRVLLAHGARRPGSTEWLLNRAIALFCWPTLFLLETRVDSRHRAMLDPTGYRTRSIDGVAMVRDLFSIFGRSHAIRPCDVLPLTALRIRVGYYIMGNYREDTRGNRYTNDQLVGMTRAALAILFRAGYSPDECCSQVPQKNHFTGFDVQKATFAPGTVVARPDGTFTTDALDQQRAMIRAISERLAAESTPDWYCPNNPTLMQRVLDTIRAAYVAVPLSFPA